MVTHVAHWEGGTVYFCDNKLHLKASRQNHIDVKRKVVASVHGWYNRMVAILYLLKWRLYWR